jgi:fibro-slime domain-containing protein
LGGRGQSLAADRPEFVSIKVVYRDFLAAINMFGSADPKGHPDFGNNKNPGIRTGLVEQTLSMEGKPVFADCGAEECPGSPLTNAANFAQWYTDVADVNKKLDGEIVLKSDSADENGNKIFRFTAPRFDPIATQGWGDLYWYTQNFCFTMEFNHLFVYHGGEYFKFTGDDSVWVFFNNRLALDLGGSHAQATKQVSLDELAEKLELVKGKTVMMHVFYADLGASSANFKIETNLQLDEDPCVEYDRITLVAQPSGDSALSWSGKALTAGSEDGTDVTVEFACSSEAGCEGAGATRVVNVPAISLAPGGDVTFTLKVSASTADLGFTSPALTFYDLEANEAVGAKGLDTFVDMQTKTITYTGKDELDWDMFHGGVPADPSDDPHIPSSPLTEQQKNKMVTLKFVDLETAEIRLRNNGTEMAVFPFYVAAMIQCVPCNPQCTVAEPLENTKTTTVTTTTSTVATSAVQVARDPMGASGPYKCCPFGFNIPIADHWVESPVGCQDHKPWWMPWCPDPEQVTTTTSMVATNATQVDAASEPYKCCPIGFIAEVGCQDHKPWWMPWCPDEP